MTIAETVLARFRAQGESAYFGEAVTQAEHALQAAARARAEGAPETLVAAALLHDIGHLLHDAGEDAAARGIDTGHEEDGCAWLSGHFPPEVTEPVRLHVAAKRYLCATDPAYRARLSPASAQSLALQGGPFTPDEVAAFEANPHYREAVRLRRWDDEAKVVGMEVAPLEDYRSLLESLVTG